MGVDLGEVPKKSVSLSELSGKKFAVDAHNAIYQFVSSIRQADGRPLSDLKGNPTGHLTGIFYRNMRLLENGITPIYVFDGKPPDFKEEVLKERKERKLAAEIAWKAALERGETAEAKKHAQATSRLTSEMIADSKELLLALGIAVVEAPSEGEAQASQMAIEGSVDAVASQDMDCLLFGAPLLLRNLSVGGRRKLPGRSEYVEVTPEFISLSDALSTLELTREQLVWMGILIGTDFDAGVDGIGPKKAYKIVKECSSLEEAACKANADDQLELFRAVEAFFLAPPVKSKVHAQAGKLNKEKVISFLCGKHDFSEERVGRTCDAVIEKMKEVGAQTKLGNW